MHSRSRMGFGLIVASIALILPAFFSSLAYAALSDNGVDYYLQSCWRNEKDDNTYTFQFNVNQWPTGGSQKTVFRAIRDVPKNAVTGEKVIDQCGAFGALYLDGAQNTFQYDAAHAQESIDSVLNYGGWTVTADETGSASETVDYPQFYMSCRVYGYDGRTYDIWAQVRKVTDANTSTDIFTAIINDVPGAPPTSVEACASVGITTDTSPHTEAEAMAFMSQIKSDTTHSWDVTVDLTTPEASDPNKYFVKCGYYPNLGGIEVESTHVMLYQGDIETAQYGYIYGSDLNPNKTVGYRSCQTWLGVGNTYDSSTLISAIPREEITEEQYNEIFEKIEAAKEADRQYLQAWQEQNNPNTEEEATCMNSGAAMSLGWIVCPILEWMTETIEDIYSEAVKPSLQVSPELFTFETTDDEGATVKPTKEAWNAFQSFANILFIILFLVVIFSQLTGVGIDNYGIKRILPKVIVTAILVNLSYYICLASVDVSNILGNAFQALFENLPAGEPTINNISVASELGATAVSVVGIIGVLVGLGALIWANPAIVLSFFVAVLGALISIFFLFILLSARQAAIIVLIVISPLAFACYMLPNTKKLFDRWLQMGKGLLLVYPIAGLLVGGGNYVSKLLLASGFAANGIFAAITAMVVGIVPIFFIPTVLKGSFAALGNLGARISGFGDKFRGGVDRRIRNSEGFRDAQQRGQERKMRIRAGLNKDGTVATGRFARLMSAGPGRNRRRAAASAVIDKNFAIDRYSDSNYLAAKAASRQTAQEEAEVRDQEALIINSKDANGGSVTDNIAEMQRRYQEALLGRDAHGNHIGINGSMIRAYQNLLSARGDDGRQAVHRAVSLAQQQGASAEALGIHASNLINKHGGDYKANSRSTFNHANGILGGQTVDMSAYENDHAKLVDSIKPETLGVMDDDEFSHIINNTGATAASKQALADAAYEALQNESAMAGVKESRRAQITALAARSTQQQQINADAAAAAAVKQARQAQTDNYFQVQERQNQEIIDALKNPGQQRGGPTPQP